MAQRLGPSGWDRVPQGLHREAGEERHHDEQPSCSTDCRVAEAEPQQRERSEPGGDEAAPPGDLQAFPYQREQRRQQREGGKDRDDDGHRSCNAESRDECHADEEHAEQ